MENRMMKWGIFVALAAVGFSFWWLNKSWKTDIVIDNQSVSYEMPRPKAVTLGYDISGRRFMQELLPGQLPKTVAAVDAKKAPVTPPANKKDAQADAKKKADAKKAAANAAKKKAQLAVRIVGAPANGLSVIQNMAPESQPMKALPPAQENKVPVAETPVVEKEPVRTAAEWKTLLMESPSATNTKEFLKAYAMKEVAANDFYAITEELFADTRADRQTAGLYLLKTDVTPKSFAILVKHYTDQTPQALKQKIFAVMKTYGEASRFLVLSRLLYSTDARVVEMATQVLTSAVAAQGVTGQDDGGTRNPAAIPPASFRTFVPALTRLAQSENTTIAHQAQALLQSIQNLLTA